ncbi:MAG: CPBP family intramembrane metalloprotease [Hydrogenophaga sp.]|nr:CPBP family intramembrane metalloprotease [Hydrogenophaga sp.]
MTREAAPGFAGAAGSHPLTRRWPVWLVLALAFALLGWGELRATEPYSSPAFVVGYFWTELQISALLLAATLLFWRAQPLGLRLPHRPDRWTHVIPLALLVALALGARLWTGTQLPSGATAPDALTSALLLRTTVLVGLNEEWLFRGIALAAFVHWWGWRRGWLAALLAFGCVHLLNLIGGVPPVGAAFQFFNTMLAGSIFLLAAAATRSLLWPMVGHALYDWSVIDSSRFIEAGASPLGSLAVTVMALLMGGWSLWMLWRLPDRVPYPD